MTVAAVLLLSVATALAAPPHSSPPRVEATTRRWALVVGENIGLPGEETLRFAQLDAQRFRDALVDVGGFSPSEVKLLDGASAETVRDAVAHLEVELAQSAGAQDRLMVYVSAHASEGVLHLHGTELPLAELVGFVKRAPVGVGLLVVDACQSGAMTRLKGLKPAPQPIRVEASGLSGRVLISASGADEYAQESELLQGSTFTHHFLTGLRGAADTSRDGRVTLDEVYGWAWARTMESTLGTQGGLQRPTFKVELEGHGQLVLSQPAQSAGQLTIAVNAPGQWLVVGSNSLAVVADLDKPEGPMTVALAPGRYRVRLRTKDGVLERSVTVPSTGGASVGGEDLERASLVQVALKGTLAPPVTISAGGGVATGVVGVAVQPGLEVRGRLGTALVLGLNELVVSMAARDARAVAGFRQTELEVRAGLGRRFAVSRLLIALTLEPGLLLVMQNDIPNRKPRVCVGPVALAGVEVRLPIVRPLELYGLVSGGGTLLKKETGLFVSARVGASAGLAITF